jgi:hypothetical protein
VVQRSAAAMMGTVAPCMKRIIMTLIILTKLNPGPLIVVLMGVKGLMRFVH